jgi:hypothetical protein
MNFFSMGCKFKLKFELSWNFELQSFELTRFYCIIKNIFLSLVRIRTVFEEVTAVAIPRAGLRGEPAGQLSGVPTCNGH